MEVSIIIPTYNGAHKIVHLLKALESQTCKDFETLVVIDGSTDSTKLLLGQQKFTLSKLRIISQQNSGRAVSRNKGAREATGQLLVFFDDDMRPTEDCIDQHIRHHQTYTRSICVGTQIDDYKKATTDIQRYKCFLSRKWETKVNTEDKSLQKDNIYLTAANFSVAKEVFWHLGGFDERLRDGEDYDLAIKAFNAEIPIYYNQKAFAWHDDPITCQSYIKRQREYTLWNQKMNEIRAGSLEKNIERFNVSATPVWKKQIFRLFSKKIWVNAIDHSSILRVLPRPIRYKIYDLVITGLSRHYLHIKID